MYRDPSLSFAETIARLEAEVRALRALGGKRRERRLVVTTVISLCVAIHSVMGCVAAKVQADQLGHEAHRRLEARAIDLVTCAQRLEASTEEADSCRAVRQRCSCPNDYVPVKVTTVVNPD
jgi:hypothetical protein